jgi:hypothetical protein
LAAGGLGLAGGAVAGYATSEMLNHYRYGHGGYYGYGYGGDMNGITSTTSVFNNNDTFITSNDTFGGTTDIGGGGFSGGGGGGDTCMTSNDAF